eukprot:CAMPEP_0113970874 /NCGR_PEP_ID=MMETSP0011_2-20120614/11660_1 /TAXON_ID=101924 /ORGANISM="Rhodosorus marinus" /LENGTH=58 /DNA_ID=CAMNT_0000985781 /DNA_START=76 /DNA_END=248 /DNA_ORIENTATION=- /assembly_acc=CAM_ASM_000156
MSCYPRETQKRGHDMIKISSLTLLRGTILHALNYLIVERQWTQATRKNAYRRIQRTTS